MCIFLALAKDREGLFVTVGPNNWGNCIYPAYPIIWACSLSKNSGNDRHLFKNLFSNPISSVSCVNINISYACPLWWVWVTLWNEAQHFYIALCWSIRGYFSPSKWNKGRAAYLSFPVVIILPPAPQVKIAKFHGIFFIWNLSFHIAVRGNWWSLLIPMKINTHHQIDHSQYKIGLHNPNFHPNDLPE